MRKNERKSRMNKVNPNAAHTSWRKYQNFENIFFFSFLVFHITDSNEIHIFYIQTADREILMSVSDVIYHLRKKLSAIRRPKNRLWIDLHTTTSSRKWKK